MQRRRHARVDLLALVHEAAAPTDERRRPFVADALAHDERRRDAERLEILLAAPRCDRESASARPRRCDRRPRDPCAAARCDRRRPIRSTGRSLRRNLDDPLRRGAGGDRQAEPAERLADRRALMLEHESVSAAPVACRSGRSSVKTICRGSRVVVAARVDAPSARQRSRRAAASSERTRRSWLPPAASSASNRT